MKIDDLRRAICECNHFAELANALVNDMASRSDHYGISGTRLSGSVRRASMDVTRSLADLRRPWRSE